ncbi:MAG: 2Fe-2S iron-sulfur cluster binding domain-containing protein [Betaproteobacteria bacterium]|nr:2Fe-2S iron-sulfur cluster binding domain-containing protein [Betaproteobacteria bacterium]
MPQLLTLSRAARLVGITRGALQSKIKAGELATFEGMVSAEDLLRAYPEARLEDNTAFERFAQIKDSAFSRRVREHVLPNPEVLVARLTDMSRRLAQSRAGLDYYRSIVEHLQAKLRECDDAAAAPAAIAGLRAWLQHALEPDAEADAPQSLLVQDSFMRIMTAQVKVQPSGNEFFVEGNDTLLEAALRAGLSLGYGCSNGNCGLCKAKVLEGQVQKTRHYDYVLSEAEKNAGIVLMCCNTAVVDLVIEAREAQGAMDMPRQNIAAKVKSVNPLGEDIRLLRLQTPRSNRLRFLAGQSVSLTLADGAAAACPVASCPCDDRNLEFHIQRRPGDTFSEGVFAGLSSADTVRVEGPRGKFVLNEMSTRPLIFIACGGGFAPIKSLIEHAMALDVAETLQLYWMADGKTGHYLNNLCRSWADALDNFRYIPVTAEGDLTQGAVIRDALERVPPAQAELAAHDVYVAGPGTFADEAEYLLLDRGLPPSQLFVNRLPGF